MSTENVLKYLESRFSGQAVLFVDDIAQLLGRSPTAVTRLIQRDALPFPVKRLGASYCVSIFHLAQWLSSDEALADDLPLNEPPPPKGPKSPKSPSRQSHVVPLAQPTHQPLTQATKPTQPKIGLMAAQVLQMRHDAVRRWFDPKCSSNSDERGFMQALVRQLFVQALPFGGAFEVTLTVNTLLLQGWSRQQEQLACEHIEMTRKVVYEMMDRYPDEGVPGAGATNPTVTVEVTAQDGRVFKASKGIGEWDVLVDELELLPTP